MAKNVGLIKIKGSLGGLSFYESGGLNLIRQSNGPDKERIMNDPSFERTRETMSEFGGASKATKSFRRCFASTIKGMGHRYLTSELVRMFYKVCVAGSGIRGKRTIDFSGNREIFEKFDFNKAEPMGAFFYAPYENPTLNANRDLATLSIPVFDTDVYMEAPKGSTHFQILLAFGTLSNYVYDDEMEHYVPLEPDYDGLHGLAVSPYIPLGGMIPGPIDLQVDLGIGTALPASVSVLAATGIVFFQEINSQMYVLASRNAMRIDTAG
jgi:hypothetical protein